MKKRYAIPLGLLILLFGLVGLGWYTWPWQNVNADFVFGYLSLPETLHLQEADKVAAVRVVREVLTSPVQTEAPQDAPRDIPERFTVRDPRPVWVTLYLGEEPRIQGMATEESIYRSLRLATRKALEKARTKELFLTRVNEVAIQIDLFQAQAPLRSRRDGYLFFAIEPGVDGLMLSRGTRVHYQLPSDAVTRGLLTPRRPSRLKCATTLLERASLDLGIRRQGWKDEETRVERFRTLSFGASVASKGVQTYFRGNVLIPMEEVTSQRIWQGIQDGARWLLENAKENGEFNYEYLPNQDQYPTSYNAVRHAGTVYGLLELYRAFQVPEFKEAARKALPYLYQNIQSPEEGSDLLALPDGRSWPTGAAALGLLAFVNMPPELRNSDYRAVEEGLGRFLLRMIDDQGAVFEGYKAAKASRRVIKEPEYYPGEAMLALAKLYEQTGNKQWLEASQHIAEYQIARFHRTRQADHWVMQGLYQLYRHTKDVGYAQSAMAMGDVYMETQCPPNRPPFPDYHGAWRRDTETPRTTRAGSRSEALTAVMRAAQEIGEDATPYANSLIIAARHQLEQQFRRENAFFLPHPERALGGFRAGLIDNHLRIDFNQHSCVGLIGALEAAVRKEGKAPWWKELPLEPPDKVGGGAPVPAGTGSGVKLEAGASQTSGLPSAAPGTGSGVKLEAGAATPTAAPAGAVSGKSGVAAGGSGMPAPQRPTEVKAGGARPAAAEGSSLENGEGPGE